MPTFNAAYQIGNKSGFYPDEMVVNEEHSRSSLLVEKQGSADNATATDPLIACAKILQLHDNLSSPWKDQAAYLDYAKIAELLRRTTGYAVAEVDMILSNMKSLGFIEILKNLTNWEILLLTNDIVQKAKEISRFIQAKTGEQPRPQCEYLVLDDLMQLTAGDQESALMHKLSQGELPESAFILRKSEVVAILASQDRSFLREVMSEDIDEIQELECVDDQTLQRALGQMNSVEIAKLVKNTEGTTCNRILSCISGIRKHTITDIVADLDEMNFDEFVALVDAFLQLISQLKAPNNMSSIRG